MAKLTKTQAKLMQDVNTKGYALASRGSGRGADGGRVSYGNREMSAALKLIEMGLVARGRYDTERHTQRGWTIHHADLRINKLAPECVLSAIDTEPGELSDCVAAAWDCEG